MQEPRKLVYFFKRGYTDVYEEDGCGAATGSGLGNEGPEDVAALLGVKGANLATMARLGIPVPPGFTITTDVARDYHRRGGRWPEDLHRQVEEGLARVEEVAGARFGDPGNPLLLAVRSGAPVSMPGMLATVLNVGLNGETVRGLAERSGNPGFAYDTFRRFIQSYGAAVLGVPFPRSQALWDELKGQWGVHGTTGVESQWQALVDAFRARVAEEAGVPFPEEPRDQLWGAIEAVLASWHEPRVASYRERYGFPPELGTAVTVQAMVFGNFGGKSGAGVVFSRDPSTGEPRLYGECLLNAQGDEVVGGLVTPQPIEGLREVLPGAYAQLEAACRRLEGHYRDMQDVEFTIQEGRLFLLQTRTGQRSAKAAVRIAVDMVDEGLIDKPTALLRIEPESLEQVVQPAIRWKGDEEPLARGLPASPGVAVGRVVFTARDAEQWRARGEPVILVRPDTGVDDIVALDAVEGVLTARGGMTSHAAVVARGLGKCCVVGAAELVVDPEERRFTVGDTVVREGDWITLDGTDGRVLGGRVAAVELELPPSLDRLMEWCAHYARVQVRANGNKVQDGILAHNLGAQGVGLYPTEELFRDGAGSRALNLVLAGETREGLELVRAIHREEIYPLLAAMPGLPVGICLVGRPWPEAEGRLGSGTRLTRRGSGDDGSGGALVQALWAAQVRGIFEAAVQLHREGVPVRPEVLVPWGMGRGRGREEKDGGHEKEGPDGQRIISHLRQVAEGVLAEAGVFVPHRFGAFVTSGSSEAFPPDLELTGMGLEAWELVCFESLEAVRAIKEARTAPPLTFREEQEIGICGEEASDPETIAWCHRQGIHFVSCPPLRVPAALLAAAQAALKPGA